MTVKRKLEVELPDYDERPAKRAKVDEDTHALGMEVLQNSPSKKSPSTGFNFEEYLYEDWWNDSLNSSHNATVVSQTTQSSSSSSNNSTPPSVTSQNGTSANATPQSSSNSNSNSSIDTSDVKLIIKRINEIWKAIKEETAKEQIAEIENLINKAMTINPKDTEIWILLLGLRLRTGTTDEGLEICKKILNSFPIQDICYFQTACSLLFQIKDYVSNAEAIHFCRTLKQKAKTPYAVSMSNFVHARCYLAMMEKENCGAIITINHKEVLEKCFEGINFLSPMLESERISIYSCFNETIENFIKHINRYPAGHANNCFKDLTRVFLKIGKTEYFERHLEWVINLFAPVFLSAVNEFPNFSETILEVFESLESLSEKMTIPEGRFVQIVFWNAVLKRLFYEKTDKEFTPTEFGSEVFNKLLDCFKLTRQDPASSFNAEVLFQLTEASRVILTKRDQFDEIAKKDYLKNALNFCDLLMLPKFSTVTLSNGMKANIQGNIAKLSLSKEFPTI